MFDRLFISSDRQDITFIRITIRLPFPIFLSIFQERQDRATYLVSVVDHKTSSATSRVSYRLRTVSEVAYWVAQ